MLRFALALARERVAAHQQHVDLPRVAAQDLEDQVVDAHLLAAMRHAPKMMRDEPADGVDFLVRIVRAECFVELLDRKSVV